MEYIYDAFISYRHLETDEAVAKKLQSLLETRKKKDGTKLSIFRDTTEFSASSDLNASIQEALEKSEYLIIVCSPGYQHSKWCMAELNYFLQIRGGNNKILLVLAQGEPDESFPEVLRHQQKTVLDQNGDPIKARVEITPLAANVCGEHLKDRLKKLEVEYLRIAAPLLGVTFDQLYQRAQRRKTAYLVMGIAALAVLLAYSWFMIAQITQRQRLLEAKQQELYQNESVRLANEAILLMDEDPALARLLAYTALPGDLQEPDYPLTPEAEYSIRTAALQHMYAEAAAPFTPIARVAFYNTDWEFGMFFDNGNYFSVVDGQQTQLYQARTGTLIGTFPSKTIFFFDGMERCVYEGSATLENGETWYGYFVCDVRTGEELWRVERYRSPENYPLFEYERDTGRLWIVNYPYGDLLGPPPVDEVYWETAYGWFDREGVFHEDHSAPEVRGSFETVYYATKYWDYYCVNYSEVPELEEHAFWKNKAEGFSCFQEENTKLFYRVSDYEILIYEVNQENLDLPQAAPCFDYVSETGRYGFGEYTTVWDSEEEWSLFVYDTAGLEDVVYTEAWSGYGNLLEKGSYQYASRSYDCFDVTPDGTKMVIAQKDAGIAYVDISSAQTLFRIHTEDYEVYDVAVNEDGSLFAFAIELEGIAAVAVVDANTREYVGAKRLDQADLQYPIYLELRDDSLLVTPYVGEKISIYNLEDFNQDPWNIELLPDSSVYGISPFSPMLKADGLLIVPSTISSNYEPTPVTVQKILDTKTGEEIGCTTFYSVHDLYYDYDAVGGNLIMQCVDDFHVQRRGESGDFEVVYTITSQHEGMMMDSAGYVSDGTWLVLQNETYCEIYRLEDGVLCYTLRKSDDRNSQLGVIDGRLYDFCVGVSIPLPDAAEAGAYIRDVLSCDGFRRVFTDQEMKDYYIPSHWREK